MTLTEKKTSNPVVVLGGILLVVALGAYAVRSLTRETVRVVVARATYQNLTSTVSTNGKVEPIEEFQAHAAAPGVVERIYVEVGDKVKPGQLLVTMNDADIRARVASSDAAIGNAKVGLESITGNGSKEEQMGLQSDLAKAKLQQQQAANDLAALKALQQKGAASASEVASAQSRLDNANEGLQAVQARSQGRFSPAEQQRAQEQMANAKAERQAALSSYAGANIRSTIAGSVYSLPVSEYDYVNGGEELVDVADLNHVRVRAYFDEPEIGKLAEGQAVKIVWEAKPKMSWHGHIYRAPTTVITYGTRNVGECIITVDDAAGGLPPNSNVTVTVTTKEDDNVLSIPREALHTDGGDHVFRVVNGRLVRTPVGLSGVVNLTRVEVTSGLKANDVVALNASNNRDLVDGLQVKPVE